MANYSVCFSSQAYLSIVSETFAHLSTETGGIFLGKVLNDVWYVIEVLDPGYTKIQRQPGYFEYDQIYVTHLANIRARLYQSDLDLLGLWHRHPGSLDRFSGTDDETHRRYIAQNSQRGIISALVNLDPDFRLTIYHVSPTHQSAYSIQHTRIQNVSMGDEHIPPSLLAFKKPQEFVTTRQQRSFKNREDSLFSNISSVVTDLMSGAARIFTKQPQITTLSQEQVLEMLDNEIKYLERQSDYGYDVQMLEDGNTVVIKMRYVGGMSCYPSTICCKLFVRGNEKKCSIEGREWPYSPGIVKRTVDKSVDEKMREFDSRGFANKSTLSGSCQVENNVAAARVLPSINIQNDVANNVILQPTSTQQTGVKGTSNLYSTQNTSTPVTEVNKTGEKGVVCPSSSSVALSEQDKDRVIQMLESEKFDYLDQQEYYSYNVEVCDDGSLKLRMSYIGQTSSSYPKEIWCKFSLENGKKVCKIGVPGQLHEVPLESYVRGIIKRYLTNQVKREQANTQER